ncbi:transcriptional coactivator p15/PC4 family protein [Cupriavidus sp. DB3]|uniref:transcriptional coactivator p15/PC4 family protein n=1 Tax=Cupriavidus sp. DB3 TaxID=2873259 RepID=UPI001CF51632|nr:transcriptional coactivator p15/PC4 family protein [Cupriavidus sp. DB3]MCA7084064.1 transcriptional coactivator p15/PC4 family protein [Cupriavidus sp. DB3]
MTALLDIERNSSERLRVEICEYKGKTYIDLRVWFLDRDEYKRSSKGVMLRPTQVPQIIQGLMLATQAVDPNGGR